MNVTLPVGTAVPVTSEALASAVQVEQQARATAEVARAESISAARTLRQALQISSEANRRVRGASSAVRAKEARLLSPGPAHDPAARAELEAELEAARRELAQAEEEAAAANKSAVEWQDYSREVDKWRLGLERDANAAARALGRPEPFVLREPTHDVYLLPERDSLYTKLAWMLGTLEPQPPERAAVHDAQRVAVATEASPANGALLLEQLLTGNDDAAYRQTLVHQTRRHVAIMGYILSGLGESLGGETPEREALAQEMLARLVRCAERLGSAGAWPLVEAFSRGVLEEQTGTLLGQRLTDVMLAAPNGGLFAAELAAALHGSGKGACAGEVIDALREALAAARRRFVQAARVAQTLDAELCRRLYALSPGAKPAQVEAELQTFRAAHQDEYEQHEQAGALLGSLLNGAGVLLAFAKEAALPGNERTGSALQEAMLSLAHLERVAQTPYGQRLMGLALEGQGRGERTFLDMLPDAFRVLWAYGEKQPQILVDAGIDPDLLAGQGTRLLGGVGQVLAYLLAAQVLALRSVEQSGRALKLLEIALCQNPALFGLVPNDATRASQALVEMVQARDLYVFKGAFGALKGLSRDPVGGVALRALGVVVASSSLPSGLPSHAKVLTEALRRWVRDLLAGTEGLATLCAMLRRPVPSPEVARALENVRPGLLDPAFLSAARLLAGFGVLGVSPGAAGARYLEEVGSLLSLVPGLGVAQALLSAMIPISEARGTLRLVLQPAA